MEDLHPRQRRFVELVASGMPAGRAYEAAGYATEGASADACASRLLGNAKVRAALAAVQASTEDIADRAERQRFLSGIMRDAGQGTRDRLRACDLLARMAGDYATDRPAGPALVPVLVEDARAALLRRLNQAEEDGEVTVTLPANGREGD